LRVEHAELSLIGDREENQDRVLVVADEKSVLLIAIDGMGGHSDGAGAAQLAVETVRDAFNRVQHPVFDPIGFLHLAIGRAHANLVLLGANQSMGARPRATCALCLVQDGAAYFAHVGDSRIYHLRDGAVLSRTRDHSHVELLVQEGLISPDQAQSHPMRNYVESCLGGDWLLPEMVIGRLVRVQPRDTLLVCTDGFWSNLLDEDIAASFYSGVPLNTALQAITEFAVRRASVGADNSSAAVMKLL